MTRAAAVIRSPVIGRGKPRASRPEYHLTVAAAAFLRHAMPPGILWTHFPAGEARTERTGAKLKRMGLQPGWPDFLVVLPTGTIAGIELKAGAGKLTAGQSAWGEHAQRAGGYFAVCRSVEEVEATLTRWLQPFGHRLRITLNPQARNAA